MNAFFSNNRFKTVFALLLAAAILFGAGCRRTLPPEEDDSAPVQTTDPAIPAGSITVPYTALDSLNPFFTETLINFSLISLVYDVLYYLDGGFSPIACIAEDCASDGLTLRVSLAESLVFSDASPLSADDVVYSFTMAKQATLYKKSLRNIASCEAQGGRTVVFTLETPDVNAINLLTFPIVKQGTADTAEDRPVGSGCYKYVSENARVYLEYNLRHAGGIPEIGTVRMREVNESDTLMHQLNVGSIDCFFTDISDGIAKHSYSGATDIYLNNLVFLGMNQAAKLLRRAEIRKAISLAISRVSLVENAFMSHGRAAVFPFNSSWDRLSGISEPENAKFEADPDAADAILSELRLGSTGDPLYYRLIVDNENAFMRSAAKQIAEQLALVNLRITVKELSPEDFKNAVKAGEYDLYLSEIKLTKNMDLSPFFSPRGAASGGIDLERLDVDEVYASYLNGETELSFFLEAFDTAMPFVPLLYRNGHFCYSRAVKSGVEATEDRLFLNITDWKL